MGGVIPPYLTIAALWLLLVATSTSTSTDASEFLNDQVQDTTDGKLLEVVASDDYSDPHDDHGDAQVVTTDTADTTLLIHELFTNGTCSLCKCFRIAFPVMC